MNNCTFGASLPFQRAHRASGRTFGKPKCALRRLPLCMALAAVLSSGMPTQATAKILTWTGNNNTGYGGSAATGWTILNNWSTPAGEATIDFEDTLFFNNSNKLNQIIDFGRADAMGGVSGVVRNISFGAGAGAFTFNSGAQASRVSLKGDISNGSNKLQTFNAAVVTWEAGARTWDGGSAGMNLSDAWLGVKTREVMNPLSEQFW